MPYTTHSFYTVTYNQPDCLDSGGTGRITALGHASNI